LNTRRLAALLVIAACAAAALVVTIGPTLGDRPLERILPSSCIVGLNGAAVSVQLEGEGAGPQCDSWAATTITDGGSWYRYRDGTAPGGSVICQVARGSLTMTVRDAGALNLYGGGICRNLLSPPTTPP